MLDQHDLILRYKFTDRGGNRVYDVMRENLSEDENDPSFDCLGQIRMLPGKSVILAEWGAEK